MAIGKDDTWRESNIKLKHLIMELQELEEAYGDERIESFCYNERTKIYEIVFNDGNIEYISKRELARMSEDEE